MTPPPSDLTDEEAQILQDLVDDEEQDVAEAQETIERVYAKRQAREEEPYPPTEMTQVPAADDEKPEAVDDEFALPVDQPAQPGTGPSEDDVKETTREPYEGQIPSMIITAELQKAMLRSRIVIGHTFEVMAVDDTESGAKNVLELLIRERPDVYADIVVRVAMAHFICWQKGMGL